MKLMKWRIAERKLKFVSKIMARENSNITKRVLMSEVLMEDMQKVTIKGLAYECKSLSEELGIPNVVFNKVNKSTIKQATEAIDKKEKRTDMENSKKVGDRLTDNPKDNTYLSEMSLLRSRIWIRHRVRMLKGVKYNIKRSYKDLSCRFCQSGEEETQEHLEVCVGCDFERRGLKMSVRSDIVKFWIRMEKKMVEKKLQEKKEGEKKLQEKKEEEKNRDTVATVT